ncbi:fatty acid synthase-like [Schistocerca americana]|uniref:fatty acid synthase-like n=1 Tax=Schistocerca americana TaxID=7009 RepID=UPI001F4F14C0|nr:fatty acid synthase-like [Schistocerca americana]
MVNETLEEVVISGVSGVFPYSANVDELADHLFSKTNLVRSDDCRWKVPEKSIVPPATGKIPAPAAFDTVHFGIHRKQTESMDPLCCQVLERAFEAVIDAGMNPAEIRGTNTAVYMATGMSDADNVFDYEATGDGFGVMGHNRSMIAARVAYYFDTKGPTYVVITAWAGGLQVLELAYKAISEGRCKAALIGSANQVLYPNPCHHMAKAGLLSPDGATRSFDDAGNGYGRSEASVALFLQRKRDAKRIYCSVLGSGVTCMGDRQCFFPATQLQFTHLLKEFYEKFPVNPSEISYLEADGSAALGNDREELNAVDEVLLKDRKNPLLLGSVKSNIGHTEASSSLCSIVKLVIAMKTKCIPPNLHYNKPISGVPALTNGKLQVVTESTPWEGGLAAVTSRGIDGNYGHAVLKSYDHKNPTIEDDLPRLVTMSSRTEEGLNKILSKVESMPLDKEYIKLLHDIYAVSIPNYMHRGYTILTQGETKRETEFCTTANRPVWFIFSGMGSQWAQMGSQLMKLPIFAESIRKCHATLEPLGIDLINIITTADESVFDNIVNCFVGIAAIQIALVDILCKLEIHPDGIIGHSVGELGCAYADGCLTAEQMILASYYRGIASLEAELIKGMMAAIGMGYEQIKDILPPGVEVACHNSRSSCTLSGPTKSVEDFVDVLKGKGIFAKTVNVANIAYHSTYIKPAAPLLLNYLKKVIPDPKPRSSKWICASMLQKDWESDLAKTVSAEYLTNNLLSSVYFEEGSAHIPKNAICIEIAPHGLLQGILRKSLSPDCTNIPLTRRQEKQGVEYLLSAIGKLYLCGLDPKVAEIYPPVPLPVSAGTPFISPICQWDHSEEWPLISSREGTISGEIYIEFNKVQEETKDYTENVLGGNIVIPPAAFLKIALQQLMYVMEQPNDNVPAVFENVFIHRIVILPRTGTLTMMLLIKKGSGKFEFIDNGQLIVTGQIILPEDIDKQFSSLPRIANTGTKLTEVDIYTEFKHRDHQYSGKFRAINSVVVNDTGCIATIKTCEKWTILAENLLQLVMLHNAESSQDLHYVSSIRRLVLNPSKLPQNLEETEAIFHKHLNIVKCDGLEICGTDINVPPSSFPKKMVLKLGSVKFVSHNRSTFKNINEFVDVSLQIILENKAAELKSRTKGTVKDICSDRNLSETVQSSLSNFPEIQIHIDRASDFKDAQATGKILSDCILVIADETSLTTAESLLQGNEMFLLAVVSNKSSWEQGKNTVTVIQYCINGKKYLLLKKERKIDQNRSSLVNAVPKTEKWIQNLKSAAEKCTSPSHRVYVVSRALPLCGVEAFVSIIYKLTNSNNIRYFFILDETAPEFSLSDNFYKQHLLLDLTVNVYAESSWGTIRSVLPLRANTLIEEASVHLRVNDTDLSYIGLNKMDPSVISDTEMKEQSMKLGVIDFAGRNRKGQRIMGLIHPDTLKTSEHLTWNIPDNWSLEDAATVPFAFAMAYFSIKLYVTNHDPDKKILIHSGCTPFGVATINVALKEGYKVWTTVGSDEERTILKQTFPQINDDCIYSYDDRKVYNNILLTTKGRGVSLVINTLTGDKMEHSLFCVEYFGTFIQLAQADLDKNHKLGMNPFLRSISYYGISCNKLFDLNDDLKLRLHREVKEGIKKGVVKPLNRIVLDQHETHKAMKFLFAKNSYQKVLLKSDSPQKKSLAVVNNNLEVRFNCESDSSYLIIGGKNEEWLSLTQWLVKHGAKKIVIAHQTEKGNNYVTRRLNLFKKYYNSDIVLESSTKATTPNGAMSLLKLASSKGTLSAIFLLPLDQAESSRLTDAGNISAQILNNIDVASHCYPELLFICLSYDGGDNTCSARQKMGLKGLSINWSQQNESIFDFKQFVQQLDSILLSNKDPILSVTNITSDVSKNRDKVIAERLEYMLPASKREVAEIGWNLRNQHYIYEMSTLCPEWKDVKDATPVFLVSGIYSRYERHRELANKIMFPLFNILATPLKSTIEESVEDIIQEIKKIWPKGVYLLIGDSYGGVLALEIAAKLEKNGDTVNIFLLDGEPKALKTAVKTLGEGPQLQSNIIHRLLGVSLEKELTQLSDWDSRLQYALSVTDFSSRLEKQLVAEGMTAILKYLSMLLSYEPNYELYANTFLVVPEFVEEENCGLYELCKENLRIYPVGKDYETMVKSKDVARLVNFTPII